MTCQTSRVQFVRCSEMESFRTIQARVLSQQGSRTLEPKRELETTSSSRQQILVGPLAPSVLSVVPLPLSNDFVQDNRCAGGHIERILDPIHGDFDQDVDCAVLIQEVRTDTGHLVAHNHNCPWSLGKIVRRVRNAPSGGFQCDDFVTGVDGPHVLQCRIQRGKVMVWDGIVRA